MQEVEKENNKVVRNWKNNFMRSFIFSLSTCFLVVICIFASGFVVCLLSILMDEQSDTQKEEEQQ